MTDSPPAGPVHHRATSPGARTSTTHTRQILERPNPTLHLRFHQHAPCGVDIQALRPLRGRPCGPILDPDAYPGAPTTRRRTAKRKINHRRTRLTGTTPSGMTWEERPRTLRSAPEPTHINSRSAPAS